jgi:hypothetical protein
VVVLVQRDYVMVWKWDLLTCDGSRPCGAATLAGLKQISGSGGFNLGGESVVVILCTEGERGYRVPD